MPAKQLSWDAIKKFDFGRTVGIICCGGCELSIAIDLQNTGSIQSQFCTGETPVINCEREKLEFESLPEFIREPYPTPRESYVPPAASRRLTEEEDIEEVAAPKSAALDTLWPGVTHHEPFNPSRKSASFYLTIGFMAGAVVSLVGVWGYSSISHLTIGNNTTKKVVVANGAQTNPAGGRSTMVGGTEVIAPLYSTYEVKSGDTLAAIALAAYKRVSPRLLDEICKANNMRSADVLSLGQKLALPEYKPQSSQTAAAPAPGSM